MEDLKHSGVKGMHWGVRHDEHRALNPKSNKKTGKIMAHVNSLKRERQWKHVLKELDNLSTKDLNTIKKRVDLENTLKELSKSPVANKSEKQAYLNRTNMSNEELSRKITRLQVKASLHTSISKASKEQRDIGRKAIQVAGSVGVKYALTRKVELGDVFDTIKSPQTTADKAQKDAVAATVSKALRKANNSSLSSREQSINEFINAQLDKKTKPKKKS